MPYHPALEALLDGIREQTLARAMQTVTARYHEASGAGAPLVKIREEALSYAAARMDATRAAAEAALSQLCTLAPGFAPESLLDVGAGTGAATFAALSLFPTLKRCVCAERARVMSEAGAALFAACETPSVRYIAFDAAQKDAAPDPADLVVTAYMINELAPDARERVVRLLWHSTRRCV